MAARRSVLTLVLLPFRLLFEGVGELLLGLAIFAAVFYLTGLGEGSALRTLLLVAPFAALVAWIAVRRRRGPRQPGDSSSSG